MNQMLASPRTILKRGAEQLLASRPAAILSAPRRRSARLVLAYHGIVPEGEREAGERSLFVRARDFEQQLDALLEIADVVPLDQLDDADTGRPRAAITFDDAYLGAVTAGVAALARRALPATIFVAPGRLEGHVFWWDALAHARGALPESTRARALHELRGIDEPIRGWAADTGLPVAVDVPRHARSATIDELRLALTHPGITLASHSWSHANLARLTGATLRAELTRPLGWLEAKFGTRVVRWIAYPYGLRNAEVERAARESGYRGGLLIEGGWYRTADRGVFNRPRLNVPGHVSREGFRARLLGTIAVREEGPTRYRAGRISQ